MNPNAQRSTLVLLNQQGGTLHPIFDVWFVSNVIMELNISETRSDGVVVDLNNGMNAVRAPCGKPYH